MKKDVVVAFIVFLVTFSAGAQNFNYKFCLVQKDAVNIAFEFTVCNNTSTPLNKFDFVFNWPGVSNVTVDNGLNVLKNGNNGVVELEKQSWAAPLNPGCNNKFTVRMNYIFGMFPPTSGILNSDSIPGITCYVPPSFENFKCKKNFSEACFITTPSEIKIGEGTVRAWNSTRDVYVPTNRKGWPIGMAVAHAMFNNLMGFDCITPNEYFATAMQESSCGCDGGVTAPSWVTNAYNIQPTNYCADLTHGVAAGFFQEEYGTGWVELEKDIPCFIPTASFDKFIIGSKFETQAIGKVYHDFNNISYWQYIKCWNPIDFLKNAKDPYATEKLIALGYNRGLNSGEIGTLLTTSRAPAMAATNILPYLNPGGVGWVYAEQISRISAVLDNNMSAVNPADPLASSVPYPGVHSFHGFYDAQISWTDISNYIDAIAPMYAGVGLNATTFKSKIQQVFNSIKGGADASFRYELSPVIDAIVLNLPAFDPKFGLGGMYVNSGGSTCKYPTAALSKSDTVCMGRPLTLTVKLTGTAPWSFSYLSPKGAVVTLSNISTSPYVFTVKDTGVYHLTTVKDAVGPGEAICEPIKKAYFGGGAVADLMTISTIPCGPQSVQIKFTGTGPFDIEYMINGVAQAPINGITQNPYTLIRSPAPIGTYVLTRLKVNGCDIHLHDTAIVYPLNTPKISIMGNTPICLGQSAQLTVQSPSVIVTYAWSPATGLSSTNTATVKAFPARTTKYVVIATDGNGCIAKDSITLIVNPSQTITVSADTAICPGEKVTLTATGGTIYNWTPVIGLNTTNTASVVASPATTTQYTVTITDVKGCTAKDSVVLTVNPLPMITVSADTAICPGEKATLTATGGTIYNWTPVIGLNTTNTASVVASPATTTQYTVTITDVKGCTAKDSVVLTINPLPTITVSADTAICPGEKATLTATGGTIYNWTPVIGLNTTNTASVVASPATTTQYMVTITDVKGCTAKDSVVLTVNPLPTITASADTSMCLGEKATLTAIGGATYNWTPATGLDVTNAAAVIASPAFSTQYIVSGTSLKGCSAKDTVNVTILPCGFLVTVIGGSICEGTCFTLKTGISGGTGPFTYNWQPTTGNEDSLKVCPTTSTTYTVTVTDNTGNTSKGIGTVKIIPKPTIQVNSEAVCAGDPAMLIARGAATYSWSTGATTGTITVSPTVATSYTVTGTTSEGCINTAIATVSIKPKPFVNFSPDTAGCAPLTVIFNNLSTDLIAGTTCSWDFGNGKKNKACEPDPVVYTSPGTYSITLTVNNGGCSNTITRPAITVYPNPKSFFTANPKTTDMYNPDIVFTNESTNSNKSKWSFGDGTYDSSNASTYKHTYKKEGTYQICLKAQMNNCVDEYCTEVTIKPGWSFYIPNAFTPDDDDNLNPIFIGRGENITDYKLMIFNRWGNLVFETNNLSNGWNGCVNNTMEKAQQDVYVYKVSFKDGLNKTHGFIGSVTLLK